MYTLVVVAAAVMVGGGWWWWWGGGGGGQTPACLTVKQSISAASLPGCFRFMGFVRGAYGAGAEPCPLT